MSYGRGQTIGSGINPALSRVDYSPIERGGAAMGGALGQVGANIGDAIKLNKEMEKRAKSGAQIAQSIVDNFGADSNLGQNAQKTLELFNNPDASLRDRVAAADAIGQAFQIGAEALNQKRRDEQMAMEKAKLAASMAGGADPMVIGAEELAQWQRAGYNPDVVGRSPSGGYIVKSLKGQRTGAGGIGVTTAPDGSLIFGQQAPPSYGPIPGGSGSPQFIPADGAASYEPVALPDAGGMPTDGGYQNPILPALGGADPQPIVSPAMMAAGAQAIKGDVPIIEGGELKGATRVEGSRAEAEYAKLQADLDKSRAEAQKTRMEADEKAQKMQSVADAKDVFSSYIESSANAYASLDRMGAAVGTSESKADALRDFAASTGFGQNVARAFGSEAQNYRDTIQAMQPSIINVIRQQSEMGAKGLDSEKELKFYLGAMGDTTKPLAANLKALQVLDDAYGTGGAVKKMLKNNPQLLRKVEKYNFGFAPEKAEQPSQLFSPEQRSLIDKYSQ